MADGTLKVGTITTSSGSGTITLGQSGETVNVSGTAGTGFGKVLQVVFATTTTQVNNNTTSYTDTNLTASITPSSTSNKIYVIVKICGIKRSNSVVHISFKPIFRTFCNNINNSTKSFTTV